MTCEDRTVNACLCGGTWTPGRERSHRRSLAHRAHVLSSELVARGWRPAETQMVRLCTLAEVEVRSEKTAKEGRAWVEIQWVPCWVIDVFGGAFYELAKSFNSSMDAWSMLPALVRRAATDREFRDSLHTTHRLGGLAAVVGHAATPAYKAAGLRSEARYMLERGRALLADADALDGGAR